MMSLSNPMIPLAVVMLDVFGKGLAEMALADSDHPAETLVFIDRTKPPRRRWHWSLIRRPHHADSGILQPGAHRRAPLRVSVTDEQAMQDPHPVVYSG